MQVVQKLKDGLFESCFIIVHVLVNLLCAWGRHFTHLASGIGMNKCSVVAGEAVGADWLPIFFGLVKFLMDQHSFRG